MQVMQREIERLEEERIQLKIENRKMARQLGHRAAELELNVEDLQAVEQYRAALKARRKGLKSVGGVFGGESENVSSVIERHEASVTMQRDLKKAQMEMFKLENDVVEYKTKFEEMMEENDQVKITSTVFLFSQFLLIFLYSILTTDFCRKYFASGTHFCILLSFFLMCSLSSFLVYLGS